MTRRDPSLHVAQKSLLALQHFPQLRQTPLPQVLGSLGLEAAGQREHSAGAEAGEAAGTRRPRQPLRLAVDPRPAGTPANERESPFSRKNSLLLAESSFIETPETNTDREEGWPEGREGTEVAG